MDLVLLGGLIQNSNDSFSRRDRSFRTQYITLPLGSSNLGIIHEFDRVAEFKRLMAPERRKNDNHRL
ncbi:hypothetical protein S7335_165 [Synechococcus sp. PCC 7335]|uniref:hypothetical protein n=1 Tax=Synechococcus sp. (strain ATCC 29403 / PCC 7335) TaxID=91464 RepID=UPI00017EB8F3|nr:hypothetical protein [Synechococcus sp. PCC 7335]EDX82987.1 hypothetical protein S7335_165 [Synechococcus sp. PCC 7335]